MNIEKITTYSKANLKPFIRYGIVGATGTIIDVGALYVFVEIFKIPILLGATCSFILAVINNFILNKIWTFENTSKNYRKLFIKFLIIAEIGLGITLICLYLLVNILHVWYILAKLITSGVVLMWNFLGNKMWTFRSKKRSIARNETYEHELSIIIPAYNEQNRLKSTILVIEDLLLQKVSQRKLLW